MIVDIKSIQPDNHFVWDSIFETEENGICTGEIQVTPVCPKDRTSPPGIQVGEILACSAGSLKRGWQFTVMNGVRLLPGYSACRPALQERVTLEEGSGWLLCKDICIAGALRYLKVSADSGNINGQAGELFDQAKSAHRLPIPTGVQGAGLNCPF
jgi:hypothetical protein